MGKRLVRCAGTRSVGPLEPLSVTTVAVWSVLNALSHFTIWPVLTAIMEFASDGQNIFVFFVLWWHSCLFLIYIMSLLSMFVLDASKWV